MKQLLKYLLLILGLISIFSGFAQSYESNKNKNQRYCVTYRPLEKNFYIESVTSPVFKQGDCPKINLISKKKYLKQFNKIHLFFQANYEEGLVAVLTKAEALFFIEGTDLYKSLYPVLTTEAAKEKVETKEFSKKIESTKFNPTFEANLIISEEPIIKEDKTGPKIEIAKEIIIKEPNFLISGTVSDDGSDKIYIQVDETVVEAKENKFSIKRYTLTNEEIKITAIDKWGNQTTKVVKIITKIKKHVSIIKNTEKFYALLIGNNDYKHWEKLDAAVNDVVAIGKILESKYGYDVEVVTNGTSDKIRNKLIKLSKKVTSADNLLIYYSGHGDINKKMSPIRAYWIPVDAGKTLDAKWINTQDVSAYVSQISAKHILLMIDSCFAGSSIKGSSQVKVASDKDLGNMKWITKMLNRRTRLLITSGGVEPVVDASVDNHSLFAYKFLDILKTNENYTTGSKIWEALNKYHATASQNPQITWLKNMGDLGGDFFFIIKN